MALSEDVLLLVASLSVALIGFSGVVTALGRRGQGAWTRAEMLQLRTLVEPSIITLFGAFVPIVMGLVFADVDSKWRASCGLLLAGHIIGFGLFLFRGASAEVLMSHKVMTAVTLAVLAYLFGSVVNAVSNHELAFVFGLLLGIGVSIHNFYLLLFVRQAPGG